MAEQKDLTQLSNEELWAIFPILLSEYNEEWPKWYKEEEQLLIDMIGFSNIVAIHHIGSTSVPGLLAKPTVDVLLEIAEETDLKEFSEHMKQLGYLFSPQKEMPKPHMMFMKGYTPNGFDEKVFHVHVRYAGDWDELYFRDYLREQKDVMQEYAELKRGLKKLYEHDRDGYTEAKTTFIVQSTKHARKKYKDRYKK